MYISSKLLLLYCIVLICYIGVLGQRRKKPKQWNDVLNNLLPQWPECGGVISDRVVGGTTTRIHEFPWTALLDSELNGNRATCGGTLINNRYVLTAAHCVYKVPMQNILVRLGEWNRTSLGEDVENEDIRGEAYNIRAPKALSIPVQRRKIHKEYVNGNYVNDIALLRLARPVNYTQFVRPICLPSHQSFLHKNFTGYAMDVAGWGVDDNTLEHQSPIKLKAMVRVTDCGVKYNGDILICATGELGDSCRGDSGGPLMVETTVNHNPMYIVAGVVSYGQEKCGEAHKTSVYTKVDAFIDWILNNIKP